MWKSAAAVYLAIHAVGYGIAQQQELEESAPSTMMFNSPLTWMHNAPPENLLNCEGYLTADPSQNFCSQYVPPDWQPREFNGLQFYLVPLQGRAAK